MGDRVKSGEEIVIKASTWNSFLDAADYTKSQQVTRQIINRANQDSSIINVQNVSGSLMAQYSAVAITGLFCEPNSADSTAEKTLQFQYNTLFNVNIPAIASLGQWVVLTEPLANNAIGKALTIGITPCWVNITNVKHTRVDITNNSAIPSSGPTGYDLIWVAGGVGSATATGNQYVVIRAGVSFQEYDGRCTAVSGSFPTWSYTVQKETTYDSSQTNAAKWVTDGVNITGVLNSCEFGGTATYIAGTGLSVTNASTGAVNSTSCVYKAIGVGSKVRVKVTPNASGGGTTHSFYAPNSAQ